MDVYCSSHMVIFLVLTHPLHVVILWVVSYKPLTEEQQWITTLNGIIDHCHVILNLEYVENDGIPWENLRRMAIYHIVGHRKLDGESSCNLL